MKILLFSVLRKSLDESADVQNIAQGLIGVSDVSLCPQGSV